MSMPNDTSLQPQSLPFDCLSPGMKCQVTTFGQCGECGMRKHASRSRNVGSGKTAISELVEDVAISSTSLSAECVPLKAKNSISHLISFEILGGFGGLL